MRSGSSGPIGPVHRTPPAPYALNVRRSTVCPPDSIVQAFRSGIEQVPSLRTDPQFDGEVLYAVFLRRDAAAVQGQPGVRPFQKASLLVRDVGEERIAHRRRGTLRDVHVDRHEVTGDVR